MQPMVDRRPQHANVRPPRPSAPRFQLSVPVSRGSGGAGGRAGCGSAAWASAARGARHGARCSAARRRAAPACRRPRRRLWYSWPWYKFAYNTAYWATLPARRGANSLLVSWRAPHDTRASRAPRARAPATSAALHSPRGRGGALSYIKRRPAAARVSGCPAPSLLATSVGEQTCRPQHVSRVRDSLEGSICRAAPQSAVDASWWWLAAPRVRGRGGGPVHR